MPRLPRLHSVRLFDGRQRSYPFQFFWFRELTASRSNHSHLPPSPHPFSAGEGSARGSAPKAGTLAQMLAQALHSNDQALLDEVRADADV